MHCGGEFFKLMVMHAISFHASDIVINILVVWPIEPAAVAIISAVVSNGKAGAWTRHADLATKARPYFSPVS